MKCIGSSFPLISTWVTTDIQEAFDEACQAELTSQAGLMARCPDIKGNRAYQRNIASELLILRAKMSCARAEEELYRQAIVNASQFDSDSSGYGLSMFSSNADTIVGSSSFSIPLPLPQEASLYNEDTDDDYDHNDETDNDYDD